MAQTHRCVDCRALPEHPPPVSPDGLTDEELLARFEAIPQREWRPRRPRAIDPRSDPARCYAHYARARRD